MIKDKQAFTYSEPEKKARAFGLEMAGA